MTKFTLGVFFDVDLTSGGNFQQSLNNIILSNNLKSKEIDVKIITTVKNNLEFLKNFNVECHLYSPNILSKAWLKLRTFSTNRLYRFFRIFNKINNFEVFIKNLNIDLIYFCTQSLYVQYLEKTNYIYTVFDLAHLDFPEFPEVSNFRVFYEREHFLKQNLKRAVAIFSESELGKSNLILKYGLSSERVHVFPLSIENMSYLINKNYLSSDKNITFDVKQKYNLKTDYIFYPAQFWPHKNHIYILKALKILEEEEKILLSAVFSGSDQGNLDYIKKMAKKMNLENRVITPGFVNQKELNLLYSQSIALVMPTYFGPTNIPPLEAFKLKTPVLYSNLPGLKDQVGDAALLLDLNNPRSLVQNLKILLNSSELRNNLIKNGRLRLAELNFEQKKLDILKNIIKKFKILRDCWQ
jgi:glycosyltransferase involved in cell wall biosynthesis